MMKILGDKPEISVENDENFVKNEQKYQGQPQSFGVDIFGHFSRHKKCVSTDIFGLFYTKFD